MRLGEVANLIAEASNVASAGDPGYSLEIGDLAYDSRQVTLGSLFFCLKGAKDDGHRYAREATQRGAVALVCEREVDPPVPQIVVSDSRAAMNRIAAHFFANPSRQLALAGVTGTNGKTTTTHLIYSILKAAGRRAGLIGTIETRIDNEAVPGVRTTPESIDLQRLFRRLVDAGATTCAVEVTSIGIHQGRIEGTEFDVGIFTNLSQDHLDYHQSMQDYYEVKRSFFAPDRVENALINRDDSWGARLVAEVERAAFTFGLGEGSDLQAVGVRLEAKGAWFRAVGLGLDAELRLRLPGDFNVLNALAAAGTAHLLGVPESLIAEGIEDLEAVPGRFEPVDEGQDFTVVVDYAHTPDGLRNVLAASRAVVTGRVIAVFGCGGDRDRAKRPMMGEVAAKLADVVFATSDNPRSEDPRAIIEAIEEGLRTAPPSGGYRLIPDRRDAIFEAVASARPGDIVVIAGKGHETYQEIAGRLIPFDDRIVAREALRSAGRTPADPSDPIPSDALKRPGHRR
jgi:UDP-N-acetylmuramoyl-L-alanyl-D-glutamate--2,6-diaminopimelate ligase